MQIAASTVQLAAIPSSFTLRVYLWWPPPPPEWPPPKLWLPPLKLWLGALCDTDDECDEDEYDREGALNDRDGALKDRDGALYDRDGPFERYDCDGARYVCCCERNDCCADWLRTFERGTPTGPLAPPLFPRKPVLPA
jgi:hypothetical protein